MKAFRLLSLFRADPTFRDKNTGHIKDKPKTFVYLTYKITRSRLLINKELWFSKKLQISMKRFMPALEASEYLIYANIENTNTKAGWKKLKFRDNIFTLG